MEEDAQDVVEILRKSVEQVHSDEFGVPDRSRGGAGGMSNRKARKAFSHELQSVVGVGGNCTMEDMRRVANNVKYPLGDFRTMIEDLRHNGSIIRKPDGSFEVLM